MIAVSSIPILWPYLQIYVLKIAFYHKLFQDSKKHPLFPAFLGKLPMKSKIACLKTLILVTLFPVCVLIILPYESSCQNPNIGQTFQNPNHQNFQNPNFGPNPLLSNIFHIFDNPLLFWLYHTDLIYRTQKSNIRALYFDIYFYFHRMSFIHTSFSPF